METITWNNDGSLNITNCPLTLYVVNDSVFSAIPEIEMLTEEASGIDGSYVFGSRYKERYFTLHLVTEPIFDKETLRGAWRYLSAALNPKKGWYRFEQYNAPDVYGEIMVTKAYQYPLARDHIDIEVEFLLKDGFFKSVQEFIYETPGSYSEPSKTFTINVSSDVDFTPVMLKCRSNPASGTEESIFSFDGYEFRLPRIRYTEFNGERFTITRAGNNVYNEGKGTFPALVKGENTIKLARGWEMTYREWRYF